MLLLGPAYIMSRDVYSVLLGQAGLDAASAEFGDALTCHPRCPCGKNKPWSCKQPSLQSRVMHAWACEEVKL